MGSKNTMADLCLSPDIRLLVVDDNRVNLTVACAYLKVLGISSNSIETATNGLEAITQCAKKKFDLVLMDIQMPGIDGIQASRKILGEHQHKPKIVAVTASVDEVTQNELKLAGIEMMISKPVSKEGFKAVFSSLGLLSDEIS